MINKDSRYRAIVHYTHFGGSLRKVAKLYGVSKSSLQRWAKQGTSHRRARRPTKDVHADVIQCITAAIAHNPFLTWADVAHSLRTQLGSRVSRTTAGRLIKRLGFTRKKAFRVAEKTHDAAEVLEFCNQYMRTEDTLICIDECAFVVGDHGRFGYAPKGTRLNVRTSMGLRRKKYTLLAAVTKAGGIVHYEILDHNCKKADFIGFIRRLDAPSGSSLLMDNVAFHKSDETRKCMRDRGFTPLFIPPYSPRTNAIENVFGYLKHAYRTHCPPRGDASFDYCETMEYVLHLPIDLAAYFERVHHFVAQTICTEAANFVGYDT